MPKKTAKEELSAITKGSDVGPGLILKLVKEVPVAEVITAIKNMLTANMRTKDGRTVPDYRAREAGAKLYMSYVVGMPVQRVVSTAPPRESDTDTLARMLSSPAAREALRRVLAEDI